MPAQHTVRSARFAPSALALALSLAFAAHAQQSPAPTTAPSPAPAPATATPPAAPAPAPAGTPDAAPAPAAAPAPTTGRPAGAPAQRVLPGVEVTGNRTGENDQRRNSTASKIVIDRQTIEQYGDSNLGDVLRRMPGVTQGGPPGRGGPIRMRGMGGGFTQILINGERIPPGFSIEQITPEQVERIEILRAPTAETGARAIAGTINIILREPLRQLSNDVRASLQFERGEPSGNASWNRNGVLSTTGTYNATLSAGHDRNRNSNESRTTYTDLPGGNLSFDQRTRSESVNDTTRLFGSGRFQWRLGQGEMFSIQPFVVRNEFKNRSSGTLEQPVGTAPYATSEFNNKGDFWVTRFNTQLNKRLNEKARYELRASGGQFKLDSASTLRQFDGSGAQNLIQQSSNDITDRSWNLAGKLTHSLDGTHSLVVGGELEGVKRKESPVTLQNGVPQLAEFGSTLNVSTLRQALYVQDEWDPAPNWSTYLGVRWESIETKSSDAGTPVNNKSSVTTPLAQAVWRFAQPRRDQIRFALTQSYRAPNSQQLIARPSLNTQFPVPGANTPTSPDRAGNAELKPERANGIDIAYEHYFKSGGILSVNLFQRQIKDLIRNATSLETVSWAPVPRYVSRPVNLGNAVTRGIEFDAKFQLTELIDDAIPLNFRTNLSVFDSRVDQVRGPYNFIDQQPRATGNFGVDYRFRGTPWSVGGNVNWTPAYTTQITNEQQQRLSTRHVYDVFALYVVNSTTRVRFTLSNLSADDSVTESSFLLPNQLQKTVSNQRTDINGSIRLEMRL
jgi:iron complex outermembrane receptor protein